jgi:hypothetical protein
MRLKHNTVKCWEHGALAPTFMAGGMQNDLLILEDSEAFF